VAPQRWRVARVLIAPLTIGGEPLALQSAQNDFMVRLTASAMRRLPSGVCRPLPGAPPWLQQRLLGRPSSSATTLRWHGALVLRACAMHRGHQRFRLPTISSYPHDACARKLSLLAFLPTKPIWPRSLLLLGFGTMDPVPPRLPWCPALVAVRSAATRRRGRLDNRA
jgi:hypothetical protein